MSLIGGLVVPMYNEASRGSLEERLKSLVIYTEYYKVVIVNDCSTDNTKSIVSNFINNNNLKWKLINLDKNTGKGGALIEGFKYLDADFIGYLDADLSVNPSYLDRVYNLYTNYYKNLNNFCIIASRFERNSKIKNERTLVRKLVSRTSKLLLNFLFNLNVSDTQCGFKFFSKGLVKSSINLLYPSRWLIDVELLYIANKRHCKIHSMPVIWSNMEKESTMKIGNAVLNCLKDLLILLRWKKTII